MKMPPVVKSVLVLLAIALLLPLAAAAQSSSDTGNSSNSSKLSSSDKQFIEKAAEGGLAEVELGQLAVQKANGNDVKQFGERMVNDHSQANDQLKTLASQKGVALPTTLDPQDQAAKDRLSKLSGEQFDRAYMNDMVKDHTKDVSEFKKEASSAQDPDVKAFASQTLPTLESHLKQAKQIAPKERKEDSNKKLVSDRDPGSAGLTQHSARPAPRWCPNPVRSSP